MQGMVTCNVDHLTPENTLYGAHLTHQGRILYDFFMLDWDGNIALDCRKDTLMAFAKSLHDHKMRYQIDFDDLSDEYHIYADLQNTPQQRQENNGLITYPDTRLRQMGSRVLSPKELAVGKTFQDYGHTRIKNTLPDPAYDGKPGKTIVSEMCLEYLNGVDYKKGCYMGQEMTARTNFRSPPKKRLVAVTYEGDAPETGTKIKAGNLPVGEVYSCAGGHGIAIARVAKALAKGAELTADDTALGAAKPTWAEYDIE